MGKAGYYVAGIIAALGIGLGIGTTYSREIKHAANVAIYESVKLDKELRDYAPKFLVELWDRRIRKVHGMDQETLDKKQEGVLKDLENKIKENEKDP